MSTTEGRRERMERLLKCLRIAQKPLTPNEIAMRTELLTEISQDRLLKYLWELEWSGLLIKQGNRFSLPSTPCIKIKRERKTKRKKNNAGKGKGENKKKL